MNCVRTRRSLIQPQGYETPARRFRIVDNLIAFEARAIGQPTMLVLVCIQISGCGTVPYVVDDTTVTRSSVAATVRVTYGGVSSCVCDEEGQPYGNQLRVVGLSASGELSKWVGCVRQSQYPGDPNAGSRCLTIADETEVLSPPVWFALKKHILEGNPSALGGSHYCHDLQQGCLDSDHGYYNADIVVDTIKTNISWDSDTNHEQVKSTRKFFAAMDELITLPQ